MPAPTRAPYQLSIGRFILDVEARRDAKGHLAVYKLPKADGGGTFEVAGINDRYHLHQAEHLRNLIQHGQHDEAEREAVNYLLSYTDLVASWTPVTAFEAFLRDCAFNRGPGGAAKILQIALGVEVDGHVGSKTRAALNLIPLTARREFLQRLRDAREQYERHIAPPVGSRAKFWKGLVNRWNRAHQFALTFCA